MPDRRLSLKTISSELRQHAIALEALTQPDDHDLPIGWRLLLDAIDRIDLAAVAQFDRRAVA